MRLLVSNITTTNNADILSYFIDGVETPAVIQGPSVGYVYENVTRRQTSGRSYFNEVDTDVNDNNITIKAGVGNTVSFQVKDTDGNLSNIITVNLPLRYGIDIPSNGTRNDFLNRPVTYISLFNGSACNANIVSNLCNL